MALKKQLSELLTGLVDLPLMVDPLITGIVQDSRLLSKGDLFLALAGGSDDGRHYIPQAIEKGASAILCEAGGKRSKVSERVSPHFGVIPEISVNELSSLQTRLAQRYYGNISEKINLYGVTGTNAKTSITHFLAAIHLHLQKKPLVIGTVGNGFYPHLEESRQTTPDIFSLYRLLAESVQAGATDAFMEVSSHALHQKRVDGLSFDTAIFTNLSHDHLDYHGNMKNYAEAKRELFFAYPIKNAILNIDDTYGAAWALELSKKPVKLIGYSLLKNNYHDLPLVYAEKIELHEQGLQAVIQTPWGSGILSSRLMGSFNLSNLLAVVAALGVHDIPLEVILKTIPLLQGVNGRMQAIGGHQQPLVVIDYAHTPDALEKVLSALRQHCKKELICVFGCGGMRDRFKRPVMGSIAERLADRIIITDDNPRLENAADIIKDIVEGLSRPFKAEIEHNREKAIQKAIANAKPGDIVLIAGKGHENYQQIGVEKIPFNDLAVAKKELV